MLGTVELAAPGARPSPLGTLLGSGLDARLFADLSTLQPDRLIVPNDGFFVRTAYPAILDPSKQWTIRLGSRSEIGAESESTLTLARLLAESRPMGECLIECAGNSNPANFGLMSAAEWGGVPLASLLDRMHAPRGASRVLVSGIDDMSQPSRTSVPGASWIFARDDLERAGAFLATHMNGAPLPRDHGFPIRLVVPGWYGCACIKWVDGIAFVSDTAEATSQMTEYAARTHQQGQPTLARDFAPAIVDVAAMPIRVEKWAVDGHLEYHVVGVMWGGTRPTRALQIRFRPDEPFVPVTDCPLPKTTRTWSLWSHTWRPAERRTYQIVLRVDDPSIRTRRLDLFFYVREVRIDDV